MAAVIYLDTHVVAWLYAGKTEELSDACRQRLEEDEAVVSPMVVLELDYLFETKRVSEPAAVVLDEMRSLLAITVCDLPFSNVVAEARRQTWTRDPFDRIIVGQAAVRGAALLTRDRSIRRHYPSAVW